MWPLISNNQSLLCFLWTTSFLQLAAKFLRPRPARPAGHGPHCEFNLDNLLLVFRVCLRIVHFKIRSNNICPRTSHTITEKYREFKLKLKTDQSTESFFFPHSRLPLKMWVFNLPRHNTVIKRAVKQEHETFVQAEPLMTVTLNFLAVCFSGLF